MNTDIGAELSRTEQNRTIEGSREDCEDSEGHEAREAVYSMMNELRVAVSVASGEVLVMGTQQRKESMSTSTRMDR